MSRGRGATGVVTRDSLCPEGLPQPRLAALPFGFEAQANLDNIWENSCTEDRLQRWREVCGAQERTHTKITTRSAHTRLRTRAGSRRCMHTREHGGKWTQRTYTRARCTRTRTHIDTQTNARTNTLRCASAPCAHTDTHPRTRTRKHTHARIV